MHTENASVVELHFVPYCMHAATVFGAPMILVGGQDGVHCFESGGSRHQYASSDGDVGCVADRGIHRPATSVCWLFFSVLYFAY